ncbi:MAG: T9SS type A sorting domain-containing protein [Bacteroidota bacterium]
MKKSLLFFLVLSKFVSTAYSQYEAPDCGAVENIILERYYVSDASDAEDDDGGSLEEGSTTWRVYVDLKEGYVLESIFGSEENNLRIETTTEFFNNEDRGEEFGDAIPANRLGDNTVALDSYLTLGAASDEHLAVLKDEDDDGQIVAGDQNDGGSEGADGGLLVNDPADIGLPLTSADGLVEGTIVSAATGEEGAVTAIGFEAPMFGDENSGDPLVITSGAWAVLGGIVGPTDDNVILVAQITTTGEVTLELNMRIGIPEELQCSAFDCHTNMDFVFQKTMDQEVPSVANDRICSLSAPSLLSTENSTFSEEGFSIYPNPSEDAITVALSPNRLNSSYRIFDLFGRQIKEGNPNQVFGGVLNIDIADLAAGTYLLQIENEGETATQKFLKK